MLTFDAALSAEMVIASASGSAVGTSTVSASGSSIASASGTANAISTASATGVEDYVSNDIENGTSIASVETISFFDIIGLSAGIGAGGKTVAPSFDVGQPVMQFAAITNFSDLHIALQADKA